MALHIPWDKSDDWSKTQKTAADLGLELSADPDEAQRQLLAALLAARHESGEYLEAMQRIAAEFENFRKRVDRDRGDLVTGTESLISLAFLAGAFLIAWFVTDRSGAGEHRVGDAAHAGVEREE